MIVERVIEAKERKIRQSPVNANRASLLGHQCLRCLVLERTRWQEKTLHNASLQMVFDMGRAVEEMVYQDLREAGFTIIEQQRAFSWPKYQITGTVDCKLLIDGIAYPCEVKSAAPHPFESVNSVQDMLTHKYAYMRRYPAQLTLYLLMDGKERGLFLFKNKSSGQIKDIWVTIDFEFAESLVQKAETINAHVAAGTLPDCIPYDEDVCGGCGFEHICLAERVGKELEISDDSELLELVTRYMALKAGAKEYDEVNEAINKIVQGREKIMVGDYFIEGKWDPRTSYDVPKDLKEQYKTISQVWRKNIIPLERKDDK